MSAPLDVRLELLATVQFLRADGWTERAAAMEAVSAAVAELVEAATTLDRIDRGLQGWHKDARPEAMNRLRTALARMEGRA
jgi:hypothetical protein